MLKDLIGQVLRSVGISGENPLSQVTEKLKTAVKQGAGNQKKSFTFNHLPHSLEELKALPEATLQDPYATAALSVLALTSFESDREQSIAMLNFLLGPEPLNPHSLQQISDRFMDGKFYKVNSFFNGATPENNYTPSLPYTIEVSSNPYSFENDNWATMWMTSGGSDSPRPVKLRKKPSTGQWFLSEIQYLGDIRTPVAQDKWA